jgi:RHS repeat-associated protein
MDIPFGFAGGLKDNHTGLIRFGYRDFDPETGRWTARDPIGFAGGDTNLYGYVGGNPVMFFDPSGLRGISIPARPPIPANPVRIRELYPTSLQMRQMQTVLENLPDYTTSSQMRLTGNYGGNETNFFLGQSLPWVEVEICNCSGNLSLDDLASVQQCPNPNPVFVAQPQEDPNCYCYKKRVFDPSRL